MTQTEKIENYLRPPGRKITPMEAFTMFGITCLAERIRDCKKKGVKIHSEMVTKNKKRFAEYSIRL